MNRAELKAKARAQIKGKLGILFLVSFIITSIASVSGGILSLIPGGTVPLAMVISPALSLSLVNVYLTVVRGGRPEVKDSFSGFADFFSAFKVTFLIGLYTFLWSLLFIIPGIVKSISYSMSIYVLADNKGKKATQCIEQSVYITHGHKKELFILSLSFFGWLILSVFTLGILLIWVAPYMYATYANAYEALKPEPKVYVPIEELEAATKESTDNDQ